MAYKAKTATISSLRLIPKKDRIVAASIEEIPGLEVVVGKEVKVGDLMYYFPENTQLSDSFCTANDLYEKDLGNGQRKGYFDHKRRVKIIKLGGVRSEGFLVPRSYFFYLEEKLSDEEIVGLLTPGYEFDTLAGEKICKKYRVKHSNQPAKRKSWWEKTKRRFAEWRQRKNYYSAHKEFKRHPETEQLRDYIKRIPVGSLVIVTEKLHGQSARTDKLKSLKWWQKALEAVNPIPYYEWFDNYELMIGTRETVLNHRGFYKMEFRKKIAEKFKDIAPGECFTYELVGYDDAGNPLQKHSLGKFKKDYNLGYLKSKEEMHYCYGVSPEDPLPCKEFVYRLYKIDHGVQEEFTWDQTVTRCRELGLNTVPELDRFIFDGDVSAALERINSFLANDTFKPSTLDPNVLIEGVCIRVEENDPLGLVKPKWQVYKHKSFLFGVLEGYNKDSATEEEEN